MIRADLVDDFDLRRRLSSHVLDRKGVGAKSDSGGLQLEKERAWYPIQKLRAILQSLQQQTDREANQSRSNVAGNVLHDYPMTSNVELTGAARLYRAASG